MDSVDGFFLMMLTECRGNKKRRKKSLIRGVLATSKDFYGDTKSLVLDENGFLLPITEFMICVVVVLVTRDFVATDDALRLGCIPLLGVLK